MYQRVSVAFETFYPPLDVRVEVRAVPTGDGLTAHVRDITEKKERERKIERQNERLRTIIDNAPTVLFALDEEGVFTLSEGRGLEGLELDVGDFVGESAFDAFAGTRIAENVRRAIAGEVEGRIFETWYRPVENGAGTSDRVIGVAVDVTDLKQREAELRRQNERLEEFAGVVSHDLRNPLGTAAGALELARETGEEWWFFRVETAHERMGSIIEDVLALACQGQSVGETRPVSLADVVTDGWENVATDGAELVQEGDLDTIEADGSRLEALFENLFHNAVEHGMEDATVRVGRLPAGFFVEDDGPGIPDGEREQVFEHGYTTGESGSGFGLSIVATIADAHGWEASIEEGTDGGARFEITT
jgi:signal transduction histidine kinase